jgi:hypothetical protein
MKKNKKAFIPKAQNGIEGTMGGLTDKGFNYNGAWGGTMQIGGNLPGAIGNMYARHGAPSEGKYAKKTLPSAQKGMQFYQQGLDFKPKTISKNGGWLSKYEDIPQAQIGISASESTSLPRNIDPRMRAALEEDMKRTKNIIAEETKREKQGVIKNTKPFEVKDTRHWQSDSKAKERSNNPNVDFSLGVLADTFIDQIPYLAITNASEAFNSGQPLMGMSELLKQPYGPRGDAWVNFFQENPSNINIKTLEGKVFGNSDISKKQNTKLSKAEQYIANNPYFFAEESDPSFIKSLDRPFTHLRNLGAKVAFDRNPKALLNLLSIGALGSIGSRKNGGVVESYMRGLTDQGFNGSEIKKDDMGYWNPDNWGKPVEIDSNEITMQGVYQPLLGVSDTGDTQMMFPGQDYTFDGESVTEYPVMKNGGWLDKYK